MSRIDTLGTTDDNVRSFISTLPGSTISDMAAGAYALRVEQGSTKQLHLTWGTRNPNRTLKQAYDLTGCYAWLTVARTLGEQPLLVLTSGDAGGITLGGTAGTIGLTITASQTWKLSDRAHYELWVVFPSSGRQRRVIEGRINLVTTVSVADVTVIPTTVVDKAAVPRPVLEAS